MNIKGWVYVISNRAMPDLVKVGYSLKDVSLRAAELNHTGTPHAYVVEYEALVIEPRNVEQSAHKLLKHRHEGKEWFRCSVRDAVAAVREVASSQLIYEGEDYNENPLSPGSNDDTERWKITEEEVELWWRKCPATVSEVDVKNFGFDFVKFVKRTVRLQSRRLLRHSADVEYLRQHSIFDFVEAAAKVDEGNTNLADPTSVLALVIRAVNDHVVLYGPCYRAPLRESAYADADIPEEDKFGSDLVEVVNGVVLRGLCSAALHNSQRTLRFYAALSARNAHMYGTSGA